MIIVNFLVLKILSFIVSLSVIRFKLPNKKHLGSTGTKPVLVLTGQL